MKTNHCPNCDSEDISREIDIFKELNEEGYYKGNARCNRCKQSFNWKERKINFWKLIKQRTKKYGDLKK